MTNPIIQAAKLIKEADSILIASGAGMGVDSGLPDFRGDTGFWKAYPKLKEERLSFSDLANPEWFDKDPHRAWGFYGHRFKLYKNTEPHEGFDILKKWVNSKSRECFVFTSNVDGHFQKAGFDPYWIYECHGSINHFQCSKNCSSRIWHAEDIDIEIDEDKLLATGNIPRCPNCGAIARPNILMFGDAGWISSRSDQQAICFRNWKYDNLNQCKVVVIEMGAGKAIPTVRYTSESTGTQIVRINPRDSDGPKGTISIPSGALEALLEIDNQMEK